MSYRRQVLRHRPITKIPRQGSGRDRAGRVGEIYHRPPADRRRMREFGRNLSDLSRHDTAAVWCHFSAGHGIQVSQEISVV